MKTLLVKIACLVLLQAYTNSLFAHVELDYPTGGETLFSGTTITIQWHIAIPHDQLNWDLLFSSDGGATWEFIQMDLPVSTLSYQWVVPNIQTSQARISVIQDNNGMDYQDESLDFTIAASPMPPILVVGAMDLFMESNPDTEDAIQDWLDNHGGAMVTGFCNDLNWADDYIGLNYTCGNSGSAIVTFTATDDCGSTETVATVNVIDTTPPEIILGASSLSVECDGTGNTTELNAWLGNVGGAFAIDDGGSTSWVFTSPDFEDECGGSSSATYTFTAVDECNNSANTEATFAIEDHTAPDIQISAQDTTIECGLPNTQTVLESWLDRHGGAIANDVCGSVVWTNNFSAVPDTCVGTNNVAVIFTGTDACGNSKSTGAILTLLGTSGTAAPDHEFAGFTLSPNPVSDMLKIIVDQPQLLFEFLTLYDACGKPVLTIKEASGEINIPVNGYAPGMYLVQAQSSHGVMTRKVLIE